MKAHPTIITRRFPANHYTESSATASKLEEIYRVWVPRGQVWKIDHTRPFLCLLATQEDVTPTGDQSAEAVTYPVARVLQADDGSSDGDHQAVVLKADGTARGISAVADHIDSLDSPTITCTDETNAAHVYSYIPAYNGNLVIKVEAPRGQSDLNHAIMQRNTMELHTMNQPRDLRLRCDFPLPPDFAIVFYLDAAWTVAWTTGATSGAVNLPWARIQIPILTLPEYTFYKPGHEPAPGYALRQEVEGYIKSSVR